MFPQFHWTQESWKMKAVYLKYKCYFSCPAQNTLSIISFTQKQTIQKMTHKVKCFIIFLCLSPSTCCTECLTFCCCAAISSLLEANGSLVCWFCLVLFQWFFLSGRMSALCARPSPRTLDVILSTWSLHYLLSSTMLPSRCSATWNAWLASSLKPSWNCVLKRRRLFLLSPPSSHVCRSQKKIPPLLLSQRENKQSILQPSATARSHSFY